MANVSSPGAPTVSGLATSPEPGRLPYLDLVRGIAALLVMTSHLRLFVFVRSQLVAHLSFADQAFYFITGFGRQSVLIFFVLSGYLITRGILRQQHDWRWTDYAVARLARLWVVLLPALALTLAWDKLGLHFFAPDYYLGSLRSTYDSGPVPGEFSLGGDGFAGNALFLQTIAVPVYGDNRPLWSLANEFWYYALFPLGFFALHRATRPAPRVVYVLLLAAAALFVGRPTLAAAPVWLLGYGVYLANRSPRFRRVSVTVPYAGGTALLFAVLISASRLHQLPECAASDWLVGLGFALLMPPLINARMSFPPLRRIATSLADASYSLYLVHFPFLGFLATALLGNRLWVPASNAYAIFSGLFLLTILYAFAVFWLFERNTDKTRRFIRHLLPRRHEPLAT